MLNLAEIKLVVEEIEDLAASSSVQKVYAYGAHGHLFRLRAPGVTHLLLVEFSPTAGRLGFVRKKPTQPQSASAITMALRDKLTGARLTHVTCADDDRIVTLKFWAGEEIHLVLELTGRSTRATLTDGKHVIHPLGGTAETIGRGQPLLRPQTLDQSATPRWGLEHTPVGARSSVIEDAFREIEHAHAVVEAKVAARSDIGRALKRNRRLLKNLNRDLERAEKAEASKRSAELLQSAYGRVDRGAEFVEVQDFYDPDLVPVRVKIDPARSLQDNIERYFHAYRRLKGAQPAIEGRVLTVMETIEELEAAQASVASLGLESTQQLHQDLLARRLVKPKARTQRRPTDASRIVYRTFRARSGREILVGRSAKDNDVLSSRVARGRDLWLHARDWAGSHVLLRLARGEEATGADLLDAALLAAHFSKGKNDTSVDVTYTLARHVRKPKGAAFGVVTVSGGSTITVSPNSDQLAVLFHREHKK